ncbi:MAG TPA: thioredoxin domain-containing protein [Acidobacteriaceae bacterium]|nr:thioredoxin domain-containing protein [Acidobacteriaceae bacterium]
MSHPTNSLALSSSSYLRSAMHQPVDWHEWGAPAFARAAAEDKPILLDIGAVWCHWCHVMDRESYEDPGLAQVINEHFVAVKVDRDERPDVDSRYQAAVSAISGQGGWPLTAVLTPEGKPFFGGTYFPREDRYGRPGFDRVLLTMADAWKTRRAEVVESAASVIEAIEYNESFAGRSGALSLGVVDKMVASALGQFDSRYGGFGTQPKFPHPAALDLLLDVAGRTGSETARQTAVVTLERMAQGGIYDHLGGGFHRYSVDERWVVPHFEKMLYDNAGLLKNYVHAFQSFVDPRFAQVAKDILRWMDTWLSDRERGGFFASQDADINLDDDGDYFTWTRAEAAEVLSPEEMAIAGPYYDIGDLGDMHHNPQKNVLHIKHTLEEVARQAGKTREEAEGLLRSAQAKLYAARGARPTPFIDQTVYTNWNAMAVSAYLEAAQVLRLPQAREFALRTLDRILAAGWDPAKGLAHVIAYSGNAAPENGGRRWVAGLLDDYAFLVHACLDGWLATGQIHYYLAGEAVAERMIANFYDATGGGFFDAAPEDGATFGALTARRKPLQDSPTPAGNPTAAAALLRLEALGGRADFREKAEDTLETFGGVVEHFGLYAGTYGLALERLLLPPLQIVVIGEDERAEQLELVAITRYAVNKSVIRLTRAQLAGKLPPVLAGTLPMLPQLQESASFAVVCQGNACLPPASDPEELLTML